MNATRGRKHEDLPDVGDDLGAYKVVRCVGVGGMGAVYEVEKTGTTDRFAMKVMLPDIAEDAEFKARFLREARASTVIDSDHIAHVFEVGTLDNGTLYMVMELLTGIDLEQELRSRGPIGIEEAVSYVIQACDAIHGAHQHAIVHRDLKPGNLFLARQTDGRTVVKVVDFGISKALNLAPGPNDEPTLTQTDSILGSPKYMSPEQLRNPKSVDARSDIWSMGIILYRLVSNRMPFDGESLGAYITMVVSERPTPLGGFVPPDFEHIILRCLAKEMHHRYRSVASLVAALAPWAPASVAPIIQRIADKEPDLSPDDAPTNVQLGAARSAMVDALSTDTPGSVPATLAATSTGATKPAPRSKTTGILVGGAIVALGAIGVVGGSKLLDTGRPAPAATTHAESPAPPPAATSTAAPLTSSTEQANALPPPSASAVAVSSAKAPVPGIPAKPAPAATTAAAPATAPPATTARTSKGPLEQTL